MALRSYRNILSVERGGNRTFRRECVAYLVAILHPRISAAIKPIYPKYTIRLVKLGVRILYRHCDVAPIEGTPSL